MKKLFLPLMAALALTACGGTTTTTGGSVNTDQLAFKIIDTSDDFNFLNPGVVQLQLTQPTNFTVTKMVIERDDTNDGIDSYKVINTITPTSLPMVYNDTVPASGTYWYRVTAYNASGQTITTKQSVELNVETPLTTAAGTLKETPNASAYPLTKTAWTGGTGKIALETVAASPISSTTLAADGTFQFDLTAATPSAAQLVSVAPAAFLGSAASQCSGDAVPTVGLSGSAKMVLAHARVTASKSGWAIPYLTQPPITVNTTTNNQLAVGQMIYVDHPIFFSGSETCKLTGNSYSTIVKFALKLHQGWNAITAQTVSDSQGRITSIAWANEFPVGFNNQWVYFSALPAITP